MKPPDTVTASEIADWVFCPESWRLAKTGHPAANQPERDVATKRHADPAVAETAAGGSIALGRILIVLGLLALFLVWFLIQ